jgi:hypothetical protein
MLVAADYTTKNSARYVAILLIVGYALKLRYRGTISSIYERI